MRAVRLAARRCSSLSVQSPAAAAPAAVQHLAAEDYARALRVVSAQHKPIIELPPSLQSSLAAFVQAGGSGGVETLQSTRQLRAAATKLLDKLRRRSSTPPEPSSPLLRLQAKQALSEALDTIPARSRAALLKAFDSEAEVAPPPPAYSAHEVTAYAAARLPCTYAVLRRVFSELALRAPAFLPSRLLDFGAGPGTTALAVGAQWPGALAESVAVETVSAWAPLSDMLRNGSQEEPSAVPPQRVVSHLSRLRGSQQHQRYDLVVASYSLGELPTAEERRAVVHRLWGHCADMLVLIEPGTPAGSAMIREARAEVLRLEARRLRAAGIQPPGAQAGKLLASGASDTVLRDDGGEYADDDGASEANLVLMQDSVKGPAQQAGRHSAFGAHVLAPCAHERPCPMDGTTRWCHFAQRVARTAAQRSVKGAGSRTYQDERFSYVALRRGPRPDALTAAAVGAARATAMALASQADKHPPADESDEDGNVSMEVVGPSENAISAAIAAAAVGWSRVLRPPRKAKGHVVLQLCTPTGELTERVVAASHVAILGSASYRLARKARWGDAWPHPAVPRRADLLAETDS